MNSLDVQATSPLQLRNFRIPARNNWKVSHNLRGMGFKRLCFDASIEIPITQSSKEFKIFDLSQCSHSFCPSLSAVFFSKKLSNKNPSFCLMNPKKNFRFVPFPGYMLVQVQKIQKVGLFLNNLFAQTQFLR